MAQVKDYELMDKLRKFMRTTRRELHGPVGPHFRGPGAAPGRGPGCGREGGPGMPPPPMGHHGMGPYHGEPHGPGKCGRPPLSRERLLVIINKYPDGVRQKTVADEVGINQSSTSELINKLESDGYLERKVDPADKRATLLYLTEKGTARACEVEDAREERFKDIFDVLNEEEKQALSDLLDKLLAGLQETKEN